MEKLFIFCIMTFVLCNIRIFVAHYYRARQYFEEDKANDASFLIETTIRPGYARP